MSKIDCDIIKDLLPLYIDNVSSEVSGKLIEEHLTECENCKKEFELMQDAPTLTVKDKVLEDSVKTAGKKIKKLKFKTVLKTISCVLVVAFVVGLVSGFKITYNELKNSFDSNNLLALQYVDEEKYTDKNRKTPNVSTFAGSFYIDEKLGKYELKEHINDSTVSLNFEDGKKLNIMDSSQIYAEMNPNFPTKKEMVGSGIEWYFSRTILKKGLEEIGIDTTYSFGYDLNTIIDLIAEGQCGESNYPNSLVKSYATYLTYYFMIGGGFDEYRLLDNSRFDGYASVRYRKDNTLYFFELQEKNKIGTHYQLIFTGFTEEEVKEIYASFTVNK